ncbi:MAG: MFS transporter, partial [Streptomycetaceae bacterium]|nr:MFS transporter [Streptomycetaceae bacterium]
NVPLAALVAGALLAVVREPAGVHGNRRLDGWGMALAPPALGAVVGAVIAYGHGATRTAAGLGAVALVLAGVFAAAERKAPEPMLPARVFRARGLPAATAAAGLMNLTTNGVLLVVTLYLQQVRGHAALTAGLMLVPMALPLVLMAPLSGALTARYGPRPVVAGGAAVALVGSLALLRVGPDTGYGRLLPALVGLGVGNGLMVSAVTAAAMRSLPGDRAGLAGGLNNTARQVGTALGVAVFGAVVGRAATPHLFAERLHLLAWLAAGLWAAAIACAARIAVTGPGRGR